jgi:hypothetical protein
VTRLPIRVRLTAVFVAVMGAVLLVIGLFLYYRTEHNLDYRARRIADENITERELLDALGRAEELEQRVAVLVRRLEVARVARA